MRIKLRTIMAGPAGVGQAGAVVEMPDAQARAMVAAGYADAVDAPAPAAVAPVETASVEVAEVAADVGRRRGRRR
jgi:hypothetical protein